MKEMWRAKIFVKDSENDHYTHFINITANTLEELMGKLSKEFPKDSRRNYDISDVDETESLIEHVIVLDELPVRSAVDFMKAKKFNEDFRKKIDALEKLRQEQEQAYRDIYSMESEERELTAKIQEDQKSIGQSVVKRVGSKQAPSEYYHEIVTRCASNERKLTELITKKNKRKEEAKTISTEYEKLFKELSI